mmetsp:Transcript_27693/g.41204  ORF Transcript_27693/g.41204 Transcript_27693/m.41204 type:complete len:299 (-) Transcript_27693:209-1105(-)
MDFTSIVHTKSGAKAAVHPYGATVTSYQTSSGREMLFVSSTAILDGTKAIRGGIPLVFPQFGQPDTSMPQHGFLRNNTWKVGDSYDNEDAAGCDFTLALSDVVNSRGGKWNIGDTVLDCFVTLSVKVEPESLTTTLKVKNTGGTSEFDFQTLFHTYYKVNGGAALDKDRCHVSGLGGYNVQDKVTGMKYALGEDDVVFIDRETDRIYSPPSGKVAVDVVIQTGTDGSSAKLHASGSVDGKAVAVSAVVWNPHAEKAKSMGDFTDSQYHDMICVEPGILDFPKLECGKEAEFTQVITSM